MTPSPLTPSHRKSIVAALICVGFLASTAHAQEPAKAPATAEEYTKRMQSFYNSTKDFQASFKQVYTDVAAGDKDESFGRVYFKRPGRLRFDYFKKVKGKVVPQKVLVSDGKVFWVYEKAFQQVLKQCLKDSKLPTTMRFLMGQGDLSKDFNVTLAKGSKPGLPALRLVPKKPTSKYKELRFILDPKTFQVVKTTVYDPYGNTNELFFKKILLNKNIQDKSFEFKPPANARQLNKDKSC